MELCMFCDELFGEFVGNDNGCAHDRMHYTSPSFREFKAREMRTIATYLGME